MWEGGLTKAAMAKVGRKARGPQAAAIGEWAAVGLRKAWTEGGVNDRNGVK